MPIGLRKRPWTWKPPLGTPINWADPITAGLLGAWPLNEGAGAPSNLVTRAAALNVNGPTWDAGRSGAAMSFASASSQYVDLGSTFNPPAISLSCWIRAVSFPAPYNQPFGRGSGTSFSQIFVKSTGKLAMYARGLGVSIVYDGTGATTLVAGRWYHVVFTYDSISGLVGYVDGAMDNAVVANGVLNTSAVSVRIGLDPANAAQRWNGFVDAPLIWGRAITVAEVDRLYADPYCFMAPRKSYFTTAAALFIPPARRFTGFYA